MVSYAFRYGEGRKEVQGRRGRGESGARTKKVGEKPKKGRH